MKVLIGECTGKPADRAEALGWGRMWVARGRNVYTYPGEPYGVDNGAFRDWADGVPFDEDVFWGVLEKISAQPELPYLAVIPDKPGNADMTMIMLKDWLPQLLDVYPDFPWYVALQDGMVPDDIEPYVDRLAGVFLGGTNSYKRSAAQWSAWAHQPDVNLRFHYGRCGTLNKVALAQECGADSIDSAFPMWSIQRWNLFVESVLNGPIQRRMFCIP